MYTYGQSNQHQLGRAVRAVQQHAEAGHVVTICNDATPARVEFGKAGPGSRLRGPPRIVHIAAMSGSTDGGGVVAVADDGTVWVWGQNQNRQLGFVAARGAAASGDRWDAASVWSTVPRPSQVPAMLAMLPSGEGSRPIGRLNLRTAREWA